MTAKGTCSKYIGVQTYILDALFNFTLKGKTKGLFDLENFKESQCFKVNYLL